MAKQIFQLTRQISGRKINLNLLVMSTKQISSAHKRDLVRFNDLILNLELDATCFLLEHWGESQVTIINFAERASLAILFRGCRGSESATDDGRARAFSSLEDGDKKSTGSRLVIERRDKGPGCPLNRGKRAHYN